MILIGPFASQTGASAPDVVAAVVETLERCKHCNCGSFGANLTYVRKRADCAFACFSGRMETARTATQHEESSQLSVGVREGRGGNRGLKRKTVTILLIQLFSFPMVCSNSCRKGEQSLMHALRNPEHQPCLEQSELFHSDAIPSQALYGCFAGHSKGRMHLVWSLPCFYVEKVLNLFARSLQCVEATLRVCRNQHPVTLR